ncbi:transporter substrate-binding domain-containing protein [Shewanella profunda]|uniref:substrate-binding periplasmic protein n=1 Tax=Shewanella profunda TaxID=254793 RepID=UPI00200D8D0F|nr:transporter substrate-binding domain-containing protein [Shewanella profunda]MCL1089067.1 transporter substrate-binding domain-containing protein [Shewanella profunda]
MIFSKAYALVALLVLGSLCFTAQAKDLLAVGTSFSQIFEQKSNGEYTGLGVDILNRFAEQQKVTIHYQIAPWRRAQSMVERGQADILIGPYHTKEREALLAFSERAFYRDEIVFYARKDRINSWNGEYHSIKNQRIGKMQGWSYGATFTEQTQTLTINEFVDLKSGVERLSRGDLDLLATNRRNTDAEQLKLKISNTIEPILPIIDIQDGFMAFPKQEQFDPLRYRFDRFFEEMIKNGTLTTLGQKYRVTLPLLILPY